MLDHQTFQNEDLVLKVSLNVGPVKFDVSKNQSPFEEAKITRC
jgi:hypothetical protein